MIQVNCFSVTGEVLTRTIDKKSVRVRTLADNVQTKLNDVLAKVPGELIDVKISPQESVSAGVDSAFVMVLYKTADESQSTDEKEESGHAESHRRGRPPKDK